MSPPSVATPALPRAAADDEDGEMNQTAGEQQGRNDVAGRAPTVRPRRQNDQTAAPIERNGDIRVHVDLSPRPACGGRGLE